MGNWIKGFMRGKKKKRIGQEELFQQVLVHKFRTHIVQAHSVEKEKLFV